MVASGTTTFRPGTGVIASGTTMVRPGTGVVVAKPEARAPKPQVVVAVSAEAGTANTTERENTTKPMRINRLYILHTPV